MKYTDAEWLDDFQMGLELQAMRVLPTLMRAEIKKAFLAKYGDRAAARLAKFAPAMQCLFDYGDELEYSKIYLEGEKQYLASKALALGLKDYFCSLDQTRLGDPPHVDSIRRAVSKRAPC